MTSTSGDPLSFWRQYLSPPLSDLDLPLDHRRIATEPPFHCEERRVSLPMGLLDRTKALAQSSGVSLSSLYLAAYAVLLSRYSSALDVLIGSSTGVPDSAGQENCDGNFPDLTLVRVHCLPDIPFREFVQRVAGTVIDVRAHQQLPLSVITQELDLPSSGPGRGGFCQAWFVWEERPASSQPRLSDRKRQVVHLAAVQPLHGAFDIALRVRESGEGARFSLLYRDDLFEAATIETMSRHFGQLLEAAVRNPESSIDDLDMTSEEERTLLLGLYAGSRSEYPRRSLHEIFAGQVALWPNGEALVFGNERLSYRELDERSNKVAQFLTAKGIAPEDPVGIFMDPGANMIVAMLGILKAGGAYVPMDPTYPAERLQFIAEDTALRWVLTERQVRTRFPATASLVCVDAPDSPIAGCSDQPVAAIVNPESVAVIIYTSGSTGVPKGVCIPHRAAVRTVCKTNFLEVTPRDRIAQVSSPSFDAAILEIWLALLNGATLVGLRRETLLHSAELQEVLEGERISVLMLNTAFVHQIARDTPHILKGVRKIIFGGEAAEPGPLRNLLQHVGPGVLVNAYGPAEGCVNTTYYEITSLPEDVPTVPIGRPVTNARAYLLDSRLRPVPLGLRGEIYIGGDGVARGYWNRSELTEQHFIPDPFSKRPDALLYRTGDLARMRQNGVLEFIGRVDDQIKIRGHRIELAEVRQVITAHPDVQQAVLMVREDQPGDKRLVAYVTLRHQFPLATEALRQYAKHKLPAYMVPAAFVVLDSIPLNTNGKVDRQALPAPNDRPEIAAPYRAPESELECLLTRVWQEILGLDNVGIDDSFFDLGGHSLLVARLVLRIEKQIGHRISAAALFQAPTIRQLAKRLRESALEDAPVSVIELRAVETDSPPPPLFCIDWLGNNLITFRNIASLLRRDRPIYALHPERPDRQHAGISVEAVAATCIREIRRKQPRGPYQLSGICIGGVLAYEISRQLREAGEEVCLLSLIDTPLPGELQYLHARPEWKQVFDDRLGETLLLNGLARLKYLVTWLASSGMRVIRACGWPEAAHASRQKQMVAALTRMVANYRPEPYPGKITQFLCSDVPSRTYADRRLAWSSLAAEGLEVHIIPGTHLTWVDERRIRVAAEKLQRCLDRVSGQVRIRTEQQEQACPVTTVMPVRVSTPALPSQESATEYPGAIPVSM